MSDDNIEQQRKERRVQWERRFQSVMVTLVAAGIVWGVQTLVNVDKSLALAVQKQSEFEIALAGMYRSTDARRDVEGLSARIDTLSTATDRNATSIHEMQGRVRVIEDRLQIRRARSGTQAATATVGPSP